MNLVGQTLDKYKLEKIIARGPRATVYRARQLPGDRIVAVKVYDESVDPDRVRQAVEAVQALTQAHVLPVDDFGVQHGLAWVAMRYMPVGSIRARRGEPSLAALGRVAPQIASALEHAHEHGVLHLNLKPTNILLDHPGNAFVADFGIPTQVDSPYVAPEAMRGGAADVRADVYAFGAVLYELLTGRAPAARRPRDESANQRMTELPAPRSIRSGIPPAIESVVMRALSIDPDERYASAGALASALVEAIEAAARDRLEQPARRVPAIAWIGLGAIGLVLLAGVIIASSGANAPALTPSPSATSALTSTPTPSLEPTRSPTRTSTPRPTRTPAATRSTTAGPTPTATATITATLAPRTPTPSLPTFSVLSLKLRPFPLQPDGGDRLDLFFDAAIDPAIGGPFGQLFAYLPDIDSLVTTRIGAQVSSGTQLLKVTLIVDCSRLIRPFITNRIFLEIRADDRGPALYTTSIDYTKTWCR